jgi:hypothetical protein
MVLLPRLARYLAILIVLALAGAPLRDLPCPDADGAAPAGHHHHHHHHHKADCAACCCDCLGSAALALPESAFDPVRAETAAAYSGVPSMLSGRAPQPEPDPPRPVALS